jgi:NADPH-dependent ferric siderophore reductase
MKRRREPLAVKVTSAYMLTANMRRITFQGDALAKFPEDSQGAHIKLLFNKADAQRPIMRTYTIAAQRPQLNEIDVDFMLHDTAENGADEGIAAPWARRAQVGDDILIAGPGPANLINTDAEYFLLAGDMTALPALTVNLQSLPANVQGTAFIEVLSEADKQALAKPQGVDIHWVVNPHPGAEDSPLFKAIENTILPNASLAVWVACEFKTMRKIRQYLKKEQNIAKDHQYISSYWKKGNTEDQHKVLKREDAQQKEV